MAGHFRAIHVAGAMLAMSAATPAEAQRAGGMVKSARADLADRASGTYFGDVISDARGSSRSGVRFTVARVGPNQVRVSSDYSRMPAFTVTLTRAMDTIQNAHGDAVFLLDLSKRPPSLMVTVDDASWAGAEE